jgi:hypothetical protein
VLRKPPTSTNRNSFQRVTSNRFNINHLEATKFNGLQQALESGSGPGALPGAPRGNSLDSAAENFRMLKAVEMRGFHSYKFAYSRPLTRLRWPQIALNIKQLNVLSAGRPSGFAPGYLQIELTVISISMF